jgi:hypothetical protein
MGALTPVATLLGGITTALGAVNKISGAFDDLSGQSERQAAAQLRAQQDLALRQLQQQQSLQQQQATQDAALERQNLVITAQNAEEARQRALRRAVAKQRASFGGSGISPSGGSAEAVLLGLFDESEEDLRQRERLDQLKTSALSQGLAQQNSINILQTQQLRERQQLERASRF